MRKAWAVVLSGLLGCALASEDAASVESEMNAGTLDWSHPAVGALGPCSATLVTEDSVITSAECAGAAASFVVHGAGGKVAGTYTVASSRALGAVAALRLASPVPASVAAPIALALAIPGDGARVTVLGYGCASARIVDGRKRSASLLWSSSEAETTARVACPGGAGTPVLDGTGRLVALRAGALVPPLETTIREALAP